MILVNTFSIVAYDPDENAFGVAVASKFLAAQAVVSWARAGAGAVATQSYANMSYGPKGLDLMAAGSSAADTIAALTTPDPQRGLRQVGMVDPQGRAATFTGGECFAWAGGVTGEGFACQGNILVGEGVVQAMADAYTAARGELADRLYAALQAGDAAGGDKRGRQSAGVLVVRPNGGYGGETDRYLDLRVDDDPDPVTRLWGLIEMHHLYFAPPRPEDQLPITPDVARELQAMLRAAGLLAAEPTGEWDTASRTAFWELVSKENLEERWVKDSQVLDRLALKHLRRVYPT